MFYYILSLLPRVVQIVKNCRKFGWVLVNKLDGVGPVDNRPSTHKLHHFVKKKKKI